MHLIVGGSKAWSVAQFLPFSFAIVAAIGGAVEASQTVTTQTIATYGIAHKDPKHTRMVDNLQNLFSYMQGLYSDSLKQLCNASKTILKLHMTNGVGSDLCKID